MGCTLRWDHQLHRPEEGGCNLFYGYKSHALEGTGESPMHLVEEKYGCHWLCWCNLGVPHTHGRSGEAEAPFLLTALHRCLPSWLLVQLGPPSKNLPNLPGCVHALAVGWGRHRQGLWLYMAPMFYQDSPRGTAKVTPWEGAREMSAMNISIRISAC